MTFGKASGSSSCWARLFSGSRVHFGLGAWAGEIESIWPSGVRRVLRDVAADAGLDY